MSRKVVYRRMFQHVHQLIAGAYLYNAVFVQTQSHGVNAHTPSFLVPDGTPIIQTEIPGSSRNAITGGLLTPQLAVERPETTLGNRARCICCLHLTSFLDRHRSTARCWQIRTTTTRFHIVAVQISSVFRIVENKKVSGLPLFKVHGCFCYRFAIAEIIIAESLSLNLFTRGLRTWVRRCRKNYNHRFSIASACGRNTAHASSSHNEVPSVPYADENRL
jgi:hypothetical protein